MPETLLLELVDGAVEKACKGTGGAPDRPVTAETFAGFAEPEFTKIAESTVVTPYGFRACVLTLMRPAAMGAVERQLRQRQESARR